MCNLAVVVRVSRSGMLLLALFLGPFCPRALAGVVTDCVLFGDSLSDMGNFYDVTDDVPVLVPALPQSPPYFSGRFSDGPVWFERMTAALQLPALGPSRNGGANYAYGSAKTGTGSISYTFFSIPNIGTQVSQFTSTHTLRPDQLVVLWGGANDLVDDPNIDPAVPVANLAERIKSLNAVGGKQFFVPNLPPLGKTPRFVGGTSEAAMNALAANFNTALAARLTALESSLGITIQQFDVQTAFQGVLSDPAAFGLTNVTGKALTGGSDLGGTIWNGTPAPNAAQYLFWDDLHPTATGHALLGAAAAQQFAQHASAARTLTLLRQWDTAQDLTGEFRGDGDLDVTGAWRWTGPLVKRGAGTLALNLAGGTTTGPNAALTVDGGGVQFVGEGQPLVLDTLTINAGGKVAIASGAAGTTVVNFLSIANGAGGYLWGAASGQDRAAAVPEPAAGLLTVIAVLFACLVWRRGR